MEPIGKKALITSSEEILVTTEVDGNSLENLENEIFDETLDGALAEINLEVDLLENFKENADPSENNIKDYDKKHLIARIDDSKSHLRQISNSDIAIEVMEEIMLGENLPNQNKEILTDREINSTGLVESKDIKIGKNEKIIDSEGIFMKVENDENFEEKKYDSSDNKIEKLFHFTKIQRENIELNKDVESISQKNEAKYINIEKSNFGLNEVEKFKIDSQELKMDSSEVDQEKLFENLGGIDRLKTDKDIAKKNSNDDLEEIENNNNNSIISIEQKIDRNISKDIQIDESKDLHKKIITNESKSKLFSAEQFNTHTISGDFKKDSNVVSQIDLKKPEAIDIKDFAKKEIVQSYENSNTSEINRKKINFRIKENVELTGEKLLGNENSQPKVDLMKISDIEKDIFNLPLEKKIISEEFDNEIQIKVKNDFSVDETKSKEKMISSTPGIDEVTSISEKKAEIGEKLNKEKVLLEDTNVSIGKKVLISEKLNDGKVPLTEKFKFFPEENMLTKENTNEDIQKLENKKTLTDHHIFSKRREFSPELSTENIFLDSTKTEEKVQNSYGIKNTERNFDRDFFENIFSDTTNIKNNFSFPEVEHVAKTNSISESTSSTLVNSISENSNTSGIKFVDASNTANESFRNIDLPFDLEQIVSRVRILNGNGVEEMILRLKPEELGQITLKIRQSGAELSIDMRVDNPQVKQLIESGFDTLKNRFLDNEFAYQDLALNVDINERDSQFGRDRRNSDFEKKLDPTDETEKQDIVASEEKIGSRINNDSGLNLYV